ncbi:MAG: CinA family nicotinamide mononucleotide deamidase-related protein [Candidatus Dadabacteria bacterium]|nr:MAG: CinA family nicotinamide mononucleotide deamidase-related protein [Candidatus Dadabacteria bacterium]
MRSRSRGTSHARPVDWAIVICSTASMVCGMSMTCWTSASVRYSAILNPAPVVQLSLSWIQFTVDVMSSVDAQILLVGDELLAGELADANGPWFAERLTEAGFRVSAIRILPDEHAAIRDAVLQAVRSASLVVVAGGLGPTSDDLTTEAIADAFGLSLQLDEAQWERIRNLFRVMRGNEPPPGNEKQATIPAGATTIPNGNGTALGYLIEHEGALVGVLPGPPRENRPMFSDELLPRVLERLELPKPEPTRLFRTFGLAESVVAERLSGVEAQFPQLRIAYQFKFPEILVKLRVPAGERAAAEEAATAIEAKLAPHVYGHGEVTLPAVLGRELAARGLRIATAESCTAGLAAKLLTDAAGSSQWFDRGMVVYTNRAKREWLGVSRELLEQDGAVSEPVCEAMVAGLLERSDADVAFAISGIAGPGGGTPDKPVGTVCFGWGDRRRIHTDTRQFHWDREYNRLISAWVACWHIREMIVQS